MKISIRFKIIGLGAVLSILATSVALVFGTIEYRNRAKDRMLQTIDSWLDNLSADFQESDVRGQTINFVLETKQYIDEIYQAQPDDQPFDTYEDYRNYLKIKYLWLYPFDGLSMRLITQEEKDFRDHYTDLTYSLVDTKAATNAVSVFLAYYDSQRGRLVYLDDNLAVLRNNKTEYHLPGSYVEGYDNIFTHDGKYNSKVMPNGETTKVLPVTINDRGSGFKQEIAYLFVSYNFDLINEQADSLLITEAIALSLTTVGLLVMYAIGVHFFVTRNINKLTKATGDFEESLSNKSDLVAINPNIRSRDEIGSLSNSVFSLENSVINYYSAFQNETKEKEKINAELNIASKIQLEALPPYGYNDNKIGVNSFIKTAKEVGGDFYDYFYIDDNHFAFVIADVSGKGVPASLFMMRAKELIKFKVTTSKSLKDAASEINNTLIDNNKEGLFVTAFIGIVDFKNNVLRYVDAGHERPYLLSKGEVKELDVNTNFVFGGVKDFVYQTGEIPFVKEDRLFLYTDGLNESINSENEEFGYQRIDENLKKYHSAHNEQIIRYIDQALLDFTGDKEAFDDVTMMVVEYKDTKNNLFLSYNNPDFSMIEEVCDEFNKKFAFLEEEVHAHIGIIVDEILNNYISYEKRKNLRITVNFALKADYLCITFTNNGRRFDPLDKPDKYIDKYDKSLAPGGFGITIVKDLSDEILYQRKNHLNHLIIIKKVL